MTDFTKGKWNYVEWPSAPDKKAQNWYLVGSTDKAIGFIKNEADAKLLVNAPEMYNWIIDMLEYLACFSFEEEELTKLQTEGWKFYERLEGKDNEHEPRT